MWKRLKDIKNKNNVMLWIVLSLKIKFNNIQSLFNK